MLKSQGFRDLGMKLRVSPNGAAGNPGLHKMQCCVLSSRRTKIPRCNPISTSGDAWCTCFSDISPLLRRHCSSDRLQSPVEGSLTSNEGETSPLKCSGHKTTFNYVAAATERKRMNLRRTLWLGDKVGFFYLSPFKVCEQNFACATNSWLIRCSSNSCVMHATKECNPLPTFYLSHYPTRPSNSLPSL